ncbi:undecaprenyl-diphosphate phosphatase [Limisphaera sp. VF-2]|jgi:undecaprenyl-diphosphatase|uniref:undecaprenyl-diphosphate phosphatase n=1 Tax=Limisphaera sp. VF-2 TaxID=3400418 RepID=UPI0017531AE2|nr:undecaprenyl-diphosphate phosphatase [Limisphaera sp.]
MNEWLAALLLGFVEGLTEFIPVSSTGHLLLVEQLGGVGHRSDLFNVVIQCGAVLAVLPLFPERLRQLTRPWSDRRGRDYGLKLLTAFVLTGVGGVVLEALQFQLPESPVPVAVALVAGGIAFLAVEARLRRHPPRGEITWPVAVAVGLGQLIAAVFPGTSRSGATILLALLLGTGRPQATEFSFLVGIPTILAAGALKILKALHTPPTQGSLEPWPEILLATVVSAVVSFIAVKWCLTYVQRHTFELFGWYRIVLGAVILALVWF